eukprot:CAMPEP_0174374044 /NCGR_PEP_ID=MMETSP0811_2-20130205/109425_1 /TAXON_ID=73025 ORGANISM="Eutreptiella gymnastica-like, Strain CCMP1594" /NCGR_SAMPLE_ID=MMETSP0811_2 /ASSEMBLY_ACC=CAM_ASM_000667 /LENGTH=39 /DNA_ID= /DNA_START= /DNA_END= /DNA_ORIENTATION=
MTRMYQDGAAPGGGQFRDMPGMGNGAGAEAGGPKVEEVD